MPTYQYACTECGHQLEAVQSFTDEPLTVCPSCEGRLRKVFNSVGIVFKGSGFYRTDSRSSGSESSTGGKGSSVKSGSSTTGSTDSAAATSSGTGNTNGSGTKEKAATSTSGSGSSSSSSSSASSTA